MSWDIDLMKNGEIVLVSPHQAGCMQRAEVQNGNLQVVDRTEASCSVTYNYSEVYRLVDFRIQDLNGMTARDTVETLRKAVEKLGTREYRDYWAPTPGNAGIALKTLLSWAEEHPDAIWKVT